MDTIGNRQFGGERLFLWAILFVGAAIAVLMGFLTGVDSVRTIVIFLSLVATIGWLAVARRGWWLLLPALAGMGGYFYFGFRIYTHEVALLGAVIPLAMARAVRAPGMVQHQRTGFPFAMYLLSAYLFLHWAGSNIYNRLDGAGGYGNVSRAYLNALWVILFVILFARYGGTKYLPMALLLMYIVAFVRMAIGILTYVSDAFAFIPVINYVLPGSTETRAADLRASALGLTSLAFAYFLIKRSFLQKSFHFVVFLLGCAILPFGAGRTVIVLACLTPLFAAIIYRKLIAIVLGALVLAAIVFYVNTHVSLFNSVSPAVQRASSVLLLDKHLADRYGKTSGSDEWHRRLREIGYAKWTGSWNTFLFGTGIRPYDAALLTYIPGKSNVDDLLASSSKVGAYESGWWTVLAVTGLVGLLFYLYVFFFLLRKLLPILFRDGVKDHRHACAFLAVSTMSVWLGLGWTTGGFPSTEIMLGFLAFFAFQDEKQKRRTPRLSDERKLIPPTRPADLAWTPSR